MEYRSNKMNIEKLRRLIDNPKYTKKKITLADDRTLSYSECGNIQSGIPVLFCFGLMTSSVAIMFAHYAAVQHNLRMIAVDYPGIGESTHQDDRAIEGWADDMHQFCDQVIGKYARVRLMGHSLGGLHALALLCDKTFKLRVSRCLLISPWLYIEGKEYNPSWMNFARELPDFFQSSIIPSILTKLSSGSIQLAGWSNPERTSLQAAKLVTSYGMLQGQAGNEQMVRLALSKADVHLPQNMKDPIIVFHGRKDNLVLEHTSMELVRLLQERSCNAQFISLECADHNSIIAHPENLAVVMSILVGNVDEWVPPAPLSPAEIKKRTRPIPVGGPSPLNRNTRARATTPRTPKTPKRGRKNSWSTERRSPSKD